MKKRQHNNSAGAVRYLLAIGLLFVTACGSDSPVKSNGDNGEVSIPDTSTVAFARLTYTAYDADEIVETGLTLQWWLDFNSNTGRDCKILRYVVYDGSAHKLYEVHDPLPALIHSGSTLSGKARWIPVDGPTSTGNYRFLVDYQLGRETIGVDGDVHWSGPYTSGDIDTVFTVP